MRGTYKWFYLPTHDGFNSQREYEKVRGTGACDEHDLTRSKAYIQIEVVSISTHNAQRDEHVCVADFFGYRFISVRCFIACQSKENGMTMGSITIVNLTEFRPSSLQLRTWVLFIVVSTGSPITFTITITPQIWTMMYGRGGIYMD